MRLRLSGQEKKQLAKRYTENTEAYLLYQQLAELKELARQRNIQPINFAIIYTGLGEKD